MAWTKTYDGSTPVWTADEAEGDRAGWVYRLEGDEVCVRMPVTVVPGPDPEAYIDDRLMSD